MLIPRFIAFFLVAYSPTESFKNFIDINKYEFFTNSVHQIKHNKTNMNYRSFNRSSSFTTSQNQNSSQRQTTGISLNATELQSPLLLSINTNGNTQLTGQVTVDGVVIKKIQGGQTSFNLSPYLTKGTKTVEILGNYQPASSTVAIKFSGANTQVSQQTGGNGKLNQTLIITVR